MSQKSLCGLALLALGVSLLTPVALAQTYPPAAIVKDGTAVLIQDFAVAPLSSRTFSVYAPYNISFADQLSRINFMRFEPASAPGFSSRFFVCDLNRNLYIVDKTNTFSTNGWTKYINFEEVFPKFDNDPGFAGGLVTFQFDPEYATNGIFYTVHMEATNSGSAVPTNGSLPGLNVAGYTTNSVISPPAGIVSRIAVLVEWQDTNITNATFEGTAREILRGGFTGNIHPMGDLIFNPLAQPGDDDYRNLYIANGDGGAGESNISDSRHYLPQRLDTIVGKILRLTPDVNLRTNDQLAANGRYRIPTTGGNPNPFINTNGAQPEIFTYGHRNPHRFAWDAVSGQLMIFEIGLATFEEVNFIHIGDNYGYSEREGTRRLIPPGSNYSSAIPGYGTTNLPAPDLLPVRIGSNVSANLIPVRYPAAEYFQTEGDAMANGFIYRGELLPQLRGKCIYGDITTGRIFYSDFADMLSADDTNPATLAGIHEIQIVHDKPGDTNGPVERRVFDIVRDEYHRRNGTAISLPGSANITSGASYGGGRADIRLALGGDNELYLISKSDGTIRKFAAVLSPFALTNLTISNNELTYSWPTIPNRTYRVQYSTNLAETNWANLPPDLATTNLTMTLTNGITPENRFYRVLLLP